MTKQWFGWKIFHLFFYVLEQLTFYNNEAERLEDQMIFEDNDIETRDVDFLTEKFFSYIYKYVFPKDYFENREFYESHNCRFRFYKEDVERIQSAYNLAKDIHEGTFRDEDPNIDYFAHSLSVAYEVAKNGGSTDQIIAALLHDVREDDLVLRILNNRELAKIFRDEGVELITRKLCKFRNEDDATLMRKEGESEEDYWRRITLFAKKRLLGISEADKGKFCYLETPEDTSIKLPLDEYYKKVASTNGAVFDKISDKKNNLKSFGRMLASLPNKTTKESEKLFKRARKNIDEVRRYLLPIARERYSLLAKELEMITNRLENRLHIAEIWFYGYKFSYWQGEENSTEDFTHGMDFPSWDGKPTEDFTHGMNFPYWQGEENSTAESI